MLGQKRSTECRRSLRVILSRPVVPAAGFQQIDPVLTAQKVQIASPQIHTEIFQLMFRVQTDYSLPRLQHVAKQELEQVSFALAGVTQDRGAAAGLVALLLIQVHKHIGTIFLVANVESVRVRFAGIADGIEIGNAGCGKDPLHIRTQHIPAGGIDRLEALELAEKQGICLQPAPAEHRGDRPLQGLQLIHALCDQFHEYGTI